VDDRLSNIESRLRDIEQSVTRLTDRLTTLERALQSDAAHAADTIRVDDETLEPWATDAAPEHGRPDLGSFIPLIGRTCVVLGGAYLLRALTESGQLPGPSGIVLGLLYAGAWIGAADRAGATRPLSGLFHGLAGVIIGLPLLWEASTRFHLLVPNTSAAALAVMTAGALGVAWHRRLQGLAGVATVGVVITAAALAINTSQVLPYAALLLGLGVGSWWLSNVCRWSWLRWPAAMAADLFFLGLVVRASAEVPLEPPEWVVGAQIVLVAGYLGAFTVYAAARRRPVRPFEVLQTTLVLGVGLGGALVVARTLGGGIPAWIGGGSLAVALAAYLIAFLRLQPTATLESNFYYFTTLALALTFVGGAVLLDGVALAIALVALTLVAAAIGASLLHPVLAAHGAAFAVGAALVSGLAAFAMTIWSGAATAWPVFPAAAWLALAAGAMGVFLPRHTVSPALESLLSAARRTLMVVMVVGVGSLATVFVGPAIAGDPPDAGTLASLKTVVLALSACTLALLARRSFGREFGWLAYPVLALGAFKLLAEDFRVSRPATLFVALALYGVALIVVSWARHGEREKAAATG
jgi:hypothetical protein